MEITVAIVEADGLARSAMQTLVESIGFSVRTYSQLDQCIAQFDATQMGCMIVGGQTDGETELTQLIPLLERQPAARVVLLTDGSPTTLVVKAMRAGISCVLEHPFSCNELVTAIELAIRENAGTLQAERKRLPEQISQLLTRQEEDIAMLLIDGAATKEIAAKLDLSVRTIHYRKNTIFKKIGASNRNQAIKLLTRQSPMGKPCPV